MSKKFYVKNYGLVETLKRCRFQLNLNRYEAGSNKGSKLLYGSYIAFVPPHKLSFGSEKILYGYKNFPNLSVILRSLDIFYIIWILPSPQIIKWSALSIILNPYDIYGLLATDQVT